MKQENDHSYTNNSSDPQSEEIRRSWNQTKFSSERLHENIDEIKSGKRRTALQNLARRYRWFSNFALIFIFVWPLLATSHLLMGFHATWIIIFGEIYFGICSMIDRWMYRGVSSINVATMSVSEVCERALYYRKRHLQSIIILLPMAMILIGSMAYVMDFDPYMIMGICTGAIVGFLIGLRQLHHFLDDYRQFKD